MGECQHGTNDWWSCIECLREKSAVFDRYSIYLEDRDRHLFAQAQSLNELQVHIDRLEQVVAAAIRWQDCSRLSVQGLADADDELVDALNRYRYATAPPPAQEEDK